MQRRAKCVSFDNVWAVSLGMQKQWTSDCSSGIIISLSLLRRSLINLSLIFLNCLCPGDRCHSSLDSLVDLLICNLVVLKEGAIPMNFSSPEVWCWYQNNTQSRIVRVLHSKEDLTSKWVDILNRRSRMKQPNFAHYPSTDSRWPSMFLQTIVYQLFLQIAADFWSLHVSFLWIKILDCNFLGKHRQKIFF